MKKIFFSNNVKFLRKSRGMLQSEILSAIGFKPTTWSGYENGISFPKFEDLIKISEYFGVNESDLINTDLQHAHLNKKEDSKYFEENAHLNAHRNAHLTTQNNQISEPAPVYITLQNDPKDAKNEVAIPITDISVAAGAGAVNNEYIDVSETIQLPSSMVKRNSTYLAVNIKGHSMAPTLLDGGKVIVRLLDKAEWAQMHDKRVFVVVDTDGKAYLKRVKNRFEKGFIVLTSDSPDKASYPNFNMDTDQIQWIWYAELHLSFKMPNIHDNYYTKMEQMEDRLNELERKLTRN